MTQGPTHETRSGPLTGIRVLDLTSVVFGPYATQMLGDMGADVIKVESPEGDIIRHLVPTRNPGMSGVFLNSNRNKRSIVLDLKQQAARQALLRIAATADVFVHNLRPQAIGKLRLTYADVQAVKPDIIYTSAWGFGSGGPYAESPAYDDVIQAMSGVADLVRRQTGGPPALAPTILADKTCGLLLHGAILNAIIHKLRTGQGQEVEVPMYESMVSNVMVEHLQGAVFVPPLPDETTAMGYARVLAPHRKPYRTADGYMTVLPYTDRHWRSFFAAVGRPDLAADERFSSVSGRSRNVNALYATLAELMPEHTTARWQEILSEADIPHVPVRRLEDLLEDPHLREVGFFPEFTHPTEGPIRTTAVPTRLAASPGDATRMPAPRLGEHTRAVLSEAGLPASAIESLIAARAAVQG